MSSFYDWEMKFRKKLEDKNHPDKIPLNALNMKETDFKDYMRKWKEKNLM